MKNKQNRLNAIRIIIANERIANQEELLKRLYAQGFDLTQATLSRDLKQLKVAKTASSDGDYIYILPSNPLYKRITKGKQIHEHQVRSGIISVNYSANIAVIKTRPGYAGGIAYDIDEHELPSVLGTVAGDDTILLVIKEGYNHKEVHQQLSAIVPEMSA
ncbi:MAG: arginine repressor [Bacteroidaceae bacterium]|nr:arginine repressor [Bacteroidaceae bacterium]MBR3985440.1 arginine repressor [Bacteroidaceae bacterium]MBR4041406.1 arginine repressor [Bacteroidaceae bacterium]